MSTWKPKIGRHVQVFLLVDTVGGNTTYQKVRTARITALGAGNLITCRVGRFSVPGTEIYTNIDRRDDPNENLVAVKYIPQ
jgi:hypothetical protein